MNATVPKNCHHCGKAVKGRTDKKFCDDYCRNSFNNQQKANGTYSAYVRHINHALVKNRKILQQLLTHQEATSRASLDKLINLGYQFKYHTHNYTTKTGKTYYYCYEYGYLPLENNRYLLVKGKEE
jgi:predicted nucleic acid-binding Zn ribbon protein